MALKRLNFKDDGGKRGLPKEQTVPVTILTGFLGAGKNHIAQSLLKRDR